MFLYVRVSLFSSGFYPRTSRMSPTPLTVVTSEALQVDKGGERDSYYLTLLRYVIFFKWCS